MQNKKHTKHFKPKLSSLLSEFIVSVAEISDLKNILMLQEKSSKNLTEDEMSWYFKKNKAFLYPKLNLDNGCVIKVSNDNNKHIGQAIFHTPGKDGNSGMVDMPDHPSPDQNYSVIQGVTIDPGYRGHGLSKKMLKLATSIALKDPCTDFLLAEVADKNIASWSAFLSEGYVITSVGIDPDDGTKLFNLAINTKSNKPNFKEHTIEHEFTLNWADFDTLKALTEKGFVALNKSSKEQTLTLKKLKGGHYVWD